jgi:hypothetical protein
VISGNGSYGVQIFSGSDGNVVAGNEIGTDATGRLSLPNPDGIDIEHSSDNTIGGDTAVAGNLITNNSGPGVDVIGTDSLGDQITANRIFGNTGQAIDLGKDGVTYNSSSPRQGEGPNNLQNFPIFFATADGQLQGGLWGSSPDTTFHIDVFASAADNSDGSGEAQDYLGSLEVTTDTSGQVVFTVPFTAPAGLPIIRATATDPQGNTSEVSALRPSTVQAPAGVHLVPGHSLTFSATAGDTIAMQDPDAGPLDPTWDVTLSVSAGTLQMSSTAGLIGSGDGTGTLNYRGTLPALNAALEGMIYTPPQASHVLTTLSLEAQSPGASPLQAQVIITDGFVTVTTTADSGPGSLRQAILDSNAAAGPANTIDFDIPGQGVQVIAPTSSLPAITNPVLIDGTSQPGYSGTPLIELSGSRAGGGDGLTITGAGVTVRGLDINGFSQGAGIHITGTGATGDWIYSNFLGTDPTGTQAEPNKFGVEMDGGAAHNLVGTDGGGTSAAAGNLITHNDGPGVTVTGDASVGNQITANRIFGNTGQAIDLGKDGVTANSTAPRQGPNDLQNFPIIWTTADGRFQGGLGGSLPDTSFHIEFFASSAYSSDGSGEAEDYLGSLNVTSDSEGQALFDVPFTPPAGLPIVNATATDPQGNTSEVSALRRATIEVPAQTARLAAGQPVIFSTSSGDGISLSDLDSGPFDLTWNLTLSVATGALMLSSTAGLIGSGDGTGSLSYGGRLSALNAALAGLKFTPPPGFHGNTTLSLSAESDGAAPAQAQVLISDGLFLVMTTADSGPDSLQQALLDSDAATGGTNTIDFAIPGSGVQTITPKSPLPPLTTPTVIDGTSQPGYAGTPLIAIDPPVTGGSDSLAITGSNVTLLGVAIKALGLSEVDRQSSVVVVSGPVEPGLSGQIVQYQIDTTIQGRLTAQLQSQGLTARLTLLDSQGNPLVQSDGVSPGNRDSQIDEDLSPGSYMLTVELTAGSGTYVLTSRLAPASAPFQPIPVGAVPLGIAAGDFNGDGHLDLAVANSNYYSFGSVPGTVSVLLGNGDGTFQPQVTYAVGNTPWAIVAGDFNGDGRTDLAAANYGDNTISVLLGNGDGTFQPQVTYAVGSSPQAIVAGDFSGDGRTDLAIAGTYYDSATNTSVGQVSVLMGNGDGTFQPQVTYAVGSLPSAIVTGDFTGVGHIDLAVANSNSDTVSVLLGNGDGTFQPAVQYAAGSEEPDAIVAGDFTGNGRLDLAVADRGDEQNGGTDPGGVSVLLGNGDGTFQPPIPYVVGPGPDSIVAGDFNGDGHTDLAVANANYGGSGTVSVLLGNGDGTFQPQVTYAVGSNPEAIVAGDFNGDGQTDLATANEVDGTLTVLLGNGDGTFTAAQKFVTTPRATPLVADFNGDGTSDVLVIDGAGNILYRQGIPGQPGTFQPPVTVNPNNPSRDIAWVPNTDQGPLLASVDARDDAISFYAYRGGQFVRLSGSLPTGRLPAQLIAADLNGEGRDDLVIRNAGDGTLSVFFHAGPGALGTGSLPFLPPVTLPVGLGVADVQAVDTTGDGRLDLVATNKLTGQVSVLHNGGDGFFAAPVRYRAGTGLSAVDPGGTPEVSSLEATAGVAAGPFNTGGPTDLVTVNPGSNTMDVLAGLGQGRFANPVTIDTPSPAQVVRVADFNDDGIPDVAVLSAKGISVYLGNDKGGFDPPVTYDAGPEPSGLTIADLNHDGNPDLLIGNSYGDVLILLGNGDGTFQTYHEANQAITLAVADLTGKGSKDVIYADQGLDRVVVDYGAGNSTVLANQATGLLDPGAVKLADLNGDGIPDLIVANSGSNNVLIYPGLGNGQFGPAINGGHGYFVGTNPVGITVADLTGNGLPDLVVADKGSNQVSILLNQGNFRFTQGPRLKSGGTGPVSTVVGHFSGGAYPDLLVTNSGSNDVALLPGVGGGFFNDTRPQTFAVGDNPGPTFVGNFDGKPDLVTVNAGSNDLTLVSNFMSGDPVTTAIASGGSDPVTAFSFSSDSGFDNLVVGNGGDGVLALFEGSDQGLALTSSQVEADLPSPTALAFSALSGGEVQF